ncbi:MAG TPA: hypothetical protein DDW84_05515 [Phycisphaerales bacterium]|nr:MAG: hypothetical protein A2Y13_06580 [Planctomycetes bacterium GWC2_45_44]HBG78291.1 hypothetical protein [Phycisphaerales bacterium]HBR18844.1 hypothetical protein [Phycisphaerales bacterium]
MNKMHTLAKTLITIAAVYWLVLLAIQIVIYPLAMLSYGYGGRGSWGGIFVFMIVQIVILLVVLQVIYKRNKIADKIVGIEETASPQSQVEWIGFSYRLISVIAGLYCFYRAAGVVGMLIFDFWRHKMANSGMAADSQIYSHCVITVILLTGGVYLLCGAPHFVRWQVKKTKEMFMDCGK